MKNFDTDRAARRQLQGEQFTICGETFTVNTNVNPNVLLAIDSIDTDEVGIGETLKIVDAAISAMIVDSDGSDGGGRARYAALRASDSDDSLSVGDLMELAEWLIGAQAGRPTSPPADSSAGPGTTGESSTEHSSLPDSPEAEAA